MTTLPQTTPIRLPRPAGGSTPLAIPSGPAAANPAGGFQMTGSDVWRVIRANLWLVILLVVACGVGGYFFNGYLERNYAIYTATGYIRILPVQQMDPLHPVAPGAESQSLLIDQKTDAQLLHSDGLIADVLSDSVSPIRQTNWWNVTCNGDPQIARRILGDKLVATPLLDSRLVSVSMSAPEKRDTSIIVTAVVNRAIAKNRLDFSSRNAADYARMLEAKNRLAETLATNTRDLETIAAELNLRGIGTSVGLDSPLVIELAQRVNDQLRANNDKAKAQYAYDMFQAQLQRGEDPPQLGQMVRADPDVAELRRQVEGLQSELDMAQNKYGAPTARSCLTCNGTWVCSRRNMKTNRLRSAPSSAPPLQLNICPSETLRRRTLKRSTKPLTTSKRKWVISAISWPNIRRSRLKSSRNRETVDQYTKEMADMDQMTRTAAFSSLDWEELPVEPDTPTFPKMSLTMTASIVLGLALSLGIAFLREIADTTVRSPRDIQRVGQMSLLGMVPHESDDPQAAGARLPLVIFEAPHSMMAEQLRQVRTRLQHAASLDTTRSILVTSPSPGDGKSTIAVNLAAGLALNGRRILLVDANFRRPELHRIFGIGNEMGFSDVLNDVNAFATAVKETPVPNLFVMCTGPRPSNPTELLESQLLLDFIERCLEEYDHVIFDSGPMLYVSDSVALAPRVDGVVTVVRAHTNTRGVLQRMRDSLRSVKAEHLGVVLNGVRSQAGGYYGRSIKTYYAYQNES